MTEAGQWTGQWTGFYITAYVMKELKIHRYRFPTYTGLFNVKS